MKNLVFLIFIVLYPVMILAQHQSTDNINNLSFELLQQINKAEGEKNVFISAYSISNALAMTYLGAKNNTKTEMEKVLFPEHKNKVAEDLKKLNETLLLNRNIELYSANNIWLSNKLTVKKRFESDLNTLFRAQVQKANFEDEQGLEQACQNINQWVEEKTKNKIKDFIAPGVLDETTVIVLVNAVYYYAKWKVQFEETNTYKDNFTAIDNSKEETEFMHAVFSIPYYKGKDIAAVEIPYENDEASLIIILPDNFETLSKKLDYSYFKKVSGKLSIKNVDLSIPKFKQESEYDLKEYFLNMGLNDLFTSKADLSGFTGDKGIHISKIIHKAIIEINESGTEASAATAVVGSRSVPGNTDRVVFKADKPFFYFIKDNATGTILFAGSFVAP